MVLDKIVQGGVAGGASTPGTGAPGTGAAPRRRDDYTWRWICDESEEEEAQGGEGKQLMLSMTIGSRRSAVTRLAIKRGENTWSSTCC